MKRESAGTGMCLVTLGRFTKLHGCTILTPTRFLLIGCLSNHFPVPFSQHHQTPWLKHLPDQDLLPLFFLGRLF